MSHNRLRHLPSTFLSGATNLQRLKLSNNRLTRVHPNIFALSELLDLSLNSNELVELPDRVCELLSLQSLNISYNRLTELPVNKLIRMTNLTQLNFKHNLIYLPERFFSITDARTTLQYLLAKQHLEEQVEVDMTAYKIDGNAPAVAHKSQRLLQRCQSMGHLTNNHSINERMDSINVGSKPMKLSGFLKRQLQHSMQVSYALI